MKLAIVCVALALMSEDVHGQTGNRAAAFEVASVKRNKSGEQGGRIVVQPGGRFNALNATIQQVILRAYGVQGFQIAGGPSWINSERFDIDAKAASDLTPDQFSTALKTLLGERFKLAVHTETRDLPIYALVLAKKDGKLGPQLRRSRVDCDAVAAAAAAQGGAPPPVAPGEWPPCSIGFSGAGQMGARSKPLSQLLTFFSQVTGRTVVDRTGLTGGFDIDLKWTPEPSSLPLLPPGAPPADPNGPSIFTAIEEQLGLKLESQKAPLQALVIDGIELPTEN
jgi:uncharacterized protein (TIGR03435 family)